MTTQAQRERWAAENRGRELAKAECDKRIRQAGCTKSFNLNVVVTVRDPIQLLGASGVEPAAFSRAEPFFPKRRLYMPNRPYQN